MADEQIHQRLLPRTAPIKHAAKPTPEENQTDNLQAPGPPATSSALGVPGFFVQEAVRVGIQIEAGESHYNVE